MAFEPGHKKIGGKEKGTPNKTSRSLIAQLDELGMAEGKDHPVIWMYKVAHGLIKLDRVIDDVVIPDAATPELKVSCMKEVAKYVSPQLKAIEHSGKVDQAITYLESIDKDI
jgi:hypothetical protein